MQRDIIITDIIDDAKRKLNIEFSVQDEIVGGWKNRKWKVNCLNGDYCIKELSKERYSASRLIEVKKALMIQKELSDVIVPRILTFNNSTVLDSGDSNYMIMEYVQGKHKDVMTVSDLELFNLGKALAQIHLSNISDIYNGSSIIEDHYEKLHEFVEGIDSESINNDEFREISKEVERIADAIHPNFFDDMKVGFTHSDFSKDNIMFAEENVKVLDFDRGRIGYQLQDVGRAIMTFTFDGTSIEKDKLNHIVNGYNKISSITFEETIKSLRLLWIIEVAWWIHQRNFEEDIVEKLREFRDELVWLTNNFDNLEEIIKEKT